MARVYDDLMRRVMEATNRTRQATLRVAQILDQGKSAIVYTGCGCVGVGWFLPADTRCLAVKWKCQNHQPEEAALFWPEWYSDLANGHLEGGPA